METLSDSPYLLDLDAMTRTKAPHPGAVEVWLGSGQHPQPLELPTGSVMDTLSLRRDGEAMPIPR